MKKKTLTAGLVIVLSIINVWAEPGGTYTLTGKERGIAEIIKGDMEKHPDLYKGESLNSYVSKFKKENRIGKRKLSPGDQLQFPETSTSLQAKKNNAETSKKGTGGVAEVSCKMKTKKFRDGVKIYPDGGVNCTLESIPEKYKNCKITTQEYNSEEPLRFKVKNAGMVGIACHMGFTKKYTSDGWIEKEKEIELHDHNLAGDNKRKASFVLLEKHHEVGEYEMDANPPYGLHLIL